MLEANQVDGDYFCGSHNLGIEDCNRVAAPIIAFYCRNLSLTSPCRLVR